MLYFVWCFKKFTVLIEGTQTYMFPDHSYVHLNTNPVSVTWLTFGCEVTWESEALKVGDTDQQ